MHAPQIFIWHLAKLSTIVWMYLKCLLLPLTRAVQTPSRYEVDSSLPKAIRALLIVVSAWDSFLVCNFTGDSILLFKMPCQWVWVMAAETKLRKYIRVHNTGKLLQMKEHVLPLNIQMSKKGLRHADFSFDSLLTWQEGLASVLFLVTAPIQEAESFFGKIYGSTHSRNIDEMQSHMFVNGMSIEEFAANKDALFSQGALSQPDSSLMTSQIAAPKIYPGLKPRDGWWKIFVLFPNSHHCLLFQTLVWNWPHALRLLAVT